MLSKTLKHLFFLSIAAIISVSCSDDKQEENLLLNHVWNYGLVTSSFTQGGFTFNTNGQYQGTLVFEGNGAYTSNVTGGVITMTANIPGFTPITEPVPAVLDTGTYVYLEGPNKIRGVSNLSPDEETEYYIEEITSSKLVLRIDLSENGLIQQGNYFITLTR